MDQIDYSLYLITDRDLLNGRELLNEVKKAIKGGVSIVQLREKNLSSKDFYNLALALKKELQEIKVPLIINDRIDIAMAVDADGLHIGQDDIPLAVARRMMGNNKIIGMSVSTLEQAREGEKMGASYLGVGPVFFTQTKTDIDRLVGVNFLKVCKQNIKIPLVAIGGINSNNIKDIKETGVDGIAVASAILGADDVQKAAQELVSKWKSN